MATASAGILDVIRILRGLALDAVLWCCAPALFMLTYIRGYSGPVSSVTPHLLLLALPLGALLLARLLVATVLPVASWSRVVSALLVSGTLMLILGYYAVVLVGLHSWGGVVAWDVIPTVFAQAPQLTDAFGVPPEVTAAALLLLYVALATACWLYLRRYDWAAILARKISLWASMVIFVCGCGLLLVAVYSFSVDPWTRVREPLSLTFFPEANAQELEGHSLDQMAAANLDRREDAARAAYQPAAAATRPNLVLIVVDALRPDHMGVYGYARNTTPNLSRLAASGAARVVRGVHSSCGDTICGLLSLVSSKFPRNFSFHPFTLQEVVRRNGYQVHMILSGDHTHFYSLKSFYGKVDSFRDGTDAKAHGYFINDDQFAVDEVRNLPAWDHAPAMFQFHVMSAHILRKHEEPPGPYLPALRYLLQERSPDSGPGSHPIEAATNFYDDGVLKADAVIEKLLESLRQKGYLERALVVITADHGESLGEHGLFGHANSVREELLRIPLLLIAYGYQPEQAFAPHAFASQVDIAPTLLTELGLPAPSTWVGRPLQQSPEPDFTYFEQVANIGLIDHRDPSHVWKYWVDARSGAAHAFDLSTDGAEDNDLLSKVPSGRQGEWRARTLSEHTVSLAQR